MLLELKGLFSALIVMGLGHFPPGHFPPEKNVNNVVEIEDGMIKQYF